MSAYALPGGSCVPSRSFISTSCRQWERRLARSIHEMDGGSHEANDSQSFQRLALRSTQLCPGMVLNTAACTAKRAKLAPKLSLLPRKRPAKAWPSHPTVFCCITCMNRCASARLKSVSISA
jgi:hypothetical protein